MDTVNSVVGALLRGSDAAALPAGSQDFFRATPQTPHVTVLVHARQVTAAHLASPPNQPLSHERPCKLNLAWCPQDRPVTAAAEDSKSQQTLPDCRLSSCKPHEWHSLA